MQYRGISVKNPLIGENLRQILLKKEVMSAMTSPFCHLK
uniref:Uncharacterized protein n=1 Tax=Yersinia ruckeri TaxID=29486 RepID=A0A0A8VDC0_YERRU|nr:hypothetical protein CSF007_0975 [Yersinia ruckeri]